MQIKIDKGVFIPAKATSRGVKPRKYPFPEMKVGDSIKLASDKEFKSARQCAIRFANEHGVKFVTRSTVRRIWRIA